MRCDVDVCQVNCCTVKSNVVINFDFWRGWNSIHLMIRVTDRLTENLITEVVERDGQADLSKGKGDKKVSTWRLS